MLKKTWLKNNRGFSLVELLVAVSVFAILAAGVFRVVTSNYSNFYGTGDKQVVTEFAKEGAEAVRAIRNASWQDIVDQPVDTATGVSQDANGAWSFSRISDIVGDLIRTVEISHVSRNDSGNIVFIGGTADPLTRKITVTVAGSGMEDYVLEMYVSNWSIKSWLQMDWSGAGLRDFWADATMASSFSNISTSTPGQATLEASMYTSDKTITIDNTKVSGSSNLTNFPMFFSTNLNSLKTTAHGGDMTDDNAYDLIFTSDAEATTQLDYEIQSYNSSTGALEAWVEIPSLDYNDDTIIYMFYGNVDVTTSQEDVAGVWDSNYVAVLHMEEDPAISGCSGGTTEICDSSSYTNHANENGSMTNADLVNAKVGKGIDLDGADDFLSIDDSSSLDSATGADQSRTLSFWLNISNAVNNKIITEKSAFSGDHFWIQTQGTAGDIIGGVSAAASYLDSDPAPGEGTWKYITMSFIGEAINQGALYVDGALNDGPVGMTGPPDDDLPFLIGGDGFGNEVDASFDELRISNIARSFDWIVTEYNNMDSPSTFYNISTGNFTYSKSIEVDAAQVSGSGDFTNFPMLFSATSNDFKTRSNGGKVEDDNGYDIIFASDRAGLTQLDHEIESYSSSTGAINMWVEVPTLAYSATTTIYVLYGSSSISTSQENETGVWDVNYLAVWHLNQISGAYEDSTGNYDSTSVTVTDRTVACKISLCPEFDGNLDNIGIYGGAIIAQETDYTIQAWANADSAGISSERSIYDESTALGTNSRIRNDPSGIFQADVRVSVPWYSTNNADVALADTWYNSAYTLSSSAGMTVYVNGNATGTNANTSPSDQIITNSWIGKYGQSGYNWDGEIDEVRLSDIARTADWLLTEFNNQDSPSTFYIIGDEIDNSGEGVLVSSYATPGTIVSSIFDLGSSEQDLSTIRIAQDIPTSCSIQITLETDDNSNFSTAVSQVFTDTISLYTSSVTTTLDGKRWMRYEASFAACGAGNINTPTLYSVQVDYK